MNNKHKLMQQYCVGETENPIDLFITTLRPLLREKEVRFDFIYYEEFDDHISREFIGEEESVECILKSSAPEMIRAFFSDDHYAYELRWYSPYGKVIELLQSPIVHTEEDKQ